MVDMSLLPVTSSFPLTYVSFSNLNIKEMQFNNTRFFFPKKIPLHEQLFKGTILIIIKHHKALCP